jgi:hypothetical protein
MRVIICILLSFCILKAVAQQKHFEQEIGWRGKAIQLHTISDKSKQQSCTFVVGNGTIRAFVFNNKVEVIQQFNISLRSIEKVLGGFIRDNKAYIFTEQAGKDKLHNWVLDITTGETKDRFIEFDLKKEKVVDHLSGGDRFLYFTSNNKTSEFIIYNFTSEQQFDTLRYHFDESGWNDLTTDDAFSRKVSLKKVDLEGECSIDVAVRANKLYLRNDTLLLVMNNHPDSTHVVSFDVSHKKVDPWLIKHNFTLPGGEIGPYSFSDNSFLLRNKLYYLWVTSDSLCVQVVDLFSGAINKSFVAKREDTISFKNTPIVQEGGAYSSSDTRELGKTRQLLRKMVNGDAVITATPNSYNQIELIIGSYAKMSGGGGGGMYMPAGGRPGVMIMMPTGGFNRGGWVKSARFKTLLNPDTFEHVAGAIGNSINERIEYYTAGIKIPREAENLFMTNGRYYHAYYDKALRKLVILKF